jgi:hypothetical protein
MQPMNIPAGAQIMLGAPAQPMPQALSEAIGHTVAQIEGILEAHLPQCYVAEVMPKPAQILVLVVRSPDDAENVLRQTAERKRAADRGGNFGRAGNRLARSPSPFGRACGNCAFVGPSCRHLLGV